MYVILADSRSDPEAAVAVVLTVDVRHARADDQSRSKDMTDESIGIGMTLTALLVLKCLADEGQIINDPILQECAEHFFGHVASEEARRSRGSRGGFWELLEGGGWSVSEDPRRGLPLVYRDGPPAVVRSN